MKELKMLIDLDIDKIADYAHKATFKNGPELFISNDINPNLLKNESFLRKCLFDGNLIFIAEIEDDEIIKMGIFMLPDQTTQNAVISICVMPRDIQFVKKSMEYVKLFMKDSNYSKIRITLYENRYNDEFEKVLLTSGFKEEIKVNTCVGIKTLISYKII